MGVRKKSAKTIVELLSQKEKVFTNEYIKNGGNKAQAAKVAYNLGSNGGDKDKLDRTAAVMGYTVFNREVIQAYLEEMSGNAAEWMVDLAKTARSEGVRFQACKDILDRGGLKPQDKVDITTKGDKIYTDEQTKRAAEYLLNDGQEESDTSVGDTSQE